MKVKHLTKHDTRQCFVRWGYARKDSTPFWKHPYHLTVFSPLTGKSMFGFHFKRNPRVHKLFFWSGVAWVSALPYHIGALILLAILVPVEFGILRPWRERNWAAAFWFVVALAATLC